MFLRLRALRWVIVLPLFAFSLIFASGCGTPNTPADLTTCTMVLADRSDAEWDFIYLVEARQVLLMIEPAPLKRKGQARAKFYAANEVSLELYALLRHLSGVPGDVEPPSSPDAMPNWRAIYAHPRPGDLPVAPQEAAIAHDATFAAELQQLREALFQKKYAVDAPPNWAFSNEVVVKRLNFEGR